MKKKDYCTCFPEYIEGIYIGSCCKTHDNSVGKKGTYNIFTPHIKFYHNLRYKGVSKKWSLIIALGGAFLTWIRQPYFWYKIWKYRREKAKNI